MFSTWKPQVLLNTYHLLLLGQANSPILRCYIIISSLTILLWFIVSKKKTLKIEVVLLLEICLHFSATRSRTNNFSRTPYKSLLTLPLLQRGVLVLFLGFCLPCVIAESRVEKKIIIKIFQFKDLIQLCNCFDFFFVCLFGGVFCCFFVLVQRGMDPSITQLPETLAHF